MALDGSELAHSLEFGLGALLENLSLAIDRKEVISEIRLEGFDDLDLDFKDLLVDCQVLQNLLDILSRQLRFPRWLGFGDVLSFWHSSIWTK